MISAFTGLKIVESTVVENEPSAVDTIFEKQIRFDVNCKTFEGESVNIEMQAYPMPLDTLDNGREGLRARSVYYISKLFLDQGNLEYDKMKRAIQIMICGFNVFDDKKFIHHFYFADGETVLNNLLGIIYVELPKIVGKVNAPFEELGDDERWAILLENADKKNFAARVTKFMEREDFNMAMNMLSSFSKDEAERLHAISREKYEKDYSYGMRKSKEQGIMEGRIENIRQTAKNALSLGLPRDVIIKLTGLSESELTSLMMKN